MQNRLGRPIRLSRAVRAFTALHDAAGEASELTGDAIGSTASRLEALDKKHGFTEKATATFSRLQERFGVRSKPMVRITRLPEGLDQRHALLVCSGAAKSGDCLENRCVIH